MQIGDVVYHRLTGLRMMVKYVLGSELGEADCEWQDKNGEWKERRFRQENLTMKKPKKVLGIK